jgi:ABC-type multidrug transport system permease subunit
VVKVAAWIVLFLGAFGATALFLGTNQGNPRWIGVIILVVYSFAFGVLLLIARISDILVKIISQIEKN